MKPKTPNLARRPLALVLAGLLASGFASTAQAQSKSEMDALKKELAEQRALIQELLAKQKAAPVAAAPAAAPAAAAATASGTGVTWYGILDVGVENLSNVNTAPPGQKPVTENFTRVPPLNGTLPSRLGVRGSKDFGEGYQGIATAEIGFNVSDGALGQSGNQSLNNGSPRIFGRQVFVGMNSPIGSFTVGRQNSLLLDGMMISNLQGPNLWGLASFDPYIPNARMDNAVVWKKSFGEISGGLMYSFGRNNIASGAAPRSGSCPQQARSGCEAFAGFATYDNKTFGLTFGYEKQSGGQGVQTSPPGPGTVIYDTAYANLFDNANPLIPMTSNGSDDQRMTVGGYYKFGSAKVALMYLDRDITGDKQSADTQTWGLTASYDFSPKISVDGGYFYTEAKSSSPGLLLLGDGSAFVGRGFYKFDPQFATWLQLGHMSNSSNTAYALSAGAGVAPPKGGSQNGAMAGVRYMF